MIEYMYIPPEPKGASTEKSANSFLHTTDSQFKEIIRIYLQTLEPKTMIVEEENQFNSICTFSG